MGKNNKKQKEGTQTEHCPATVFISKLPFSLTTSQLEESFSDVGPIRRCFMVTKKGTTEHKGIGFVQFATAEDADRAIELKDGSDVGGRKIAVKHATHRAPLEQRRPKLNKADSDEVDKRSDEKDNVPDDDVKHAKSLDQVDKKSDENTIVPNGDKKHKKLSKEVDKTSEEKASSQKTTVKHKKSSSVDEKGPSVKPVKKAKKPSITPADKGKSSEKQRVARTVVFGGLLTADIAEEVLRLAREIDGVCSVTYPLPKGQLQNHSLHQDGCRPEAASVVYASIRSALAAVAALHQKQVNGRSVWARQLGGEGSKTQKWKIIIRNLPFKAKNSDLKEKFSAAGLVWDVFIPKNSETGMSKGFAFVKFTSKHDAENAILKFNGKQFGTRTIAVDWAVPKKLYTTGLTSSVASKDEEHGGGDADSDGDDGSEDYDLNHETHAEASDGSDINSDNSDDEVEEEQEKEVHDAVDFEEEVEVSRKILQNVITSSKETPSLNNGSDLTKNETKITTEGKQIVAKPKTVDEDLTKTVFISNLPFDLDNEEVKQRFSSFGEVQSFFPVLHPVTKRPRGTGFLKFTTADGADNAVTAANTTPGLGVFLKGRQLTVFKALDKKSANDKALEKSKVENQDQRNLYLAKEGLIVEGTPAAQGVSSDDLAKRQSLQQKKTSKLQSPNFHVSKTRLVIYNCPKSMSEKQLKKLCIDAVTSKASKQIPVIRQLKFLNDVKKGKVKGHSRGVAFVEFGEHQHAIVALRVLNNNPEPFGPNHRPIVEFAVDNVQTLRKRTLKIHDQLQKTGDNPKESQQNDKERTQKRKFQDDKRSKEDHQEQRSKTTRGDDQINKKRKRAGLEREERKLPIGDSKKGYNKQNPGEFLKAVDENPKKRKVEEVVDEGENSKKRNRSKKKDVVGKDMGDKLDVLIQQYKLKFSQKNSDANEGEKQGSRQQIRRWFQS